MWLSYKTIVYKHVPAKFLRRKRNEKLRQKINATNLLSLFHIKHPAAAHAMKGGQLTAVPKSKQTMASGLKHIIKLPRVLNKQGSFVRKRG